MTNFQHPSCWQTENPPIFEGMKDSFHTDALIVGGGLCGLLCAYKLLEKGVPKIAILEADRICSGATSHTTGKITSQHRLIYRTLIRGLGPDYARQYAKAQEQAIMDYKKIIRKESISCDFVECDSYVYTQQEKNIKKIRDEAESAKSLSIDAEFTDRCEELPFQVAGAVRFGGQARFHPLKFAYALANLLRNRGVQIYEQTTAAALEDNTVYTRRGEAFGKNVILCSHYPFVNFRGLYFSKITQSRSYVLALEGIDLPQNLYLGYDEGGLSFRRTDGEAGFLLLGGMGHKTGHECNVLHSEKLERKAEALYPGCNARFRWAAQDCMTNDSIPYIGHYRQLGRHVYLATGFNKWGMTNSMAAAEIISNLIVNGTSETGAVFSPGRPSFSLQAPAFFREATDTAANYIKGYTAVPRGGTMDLKNGQGGLVDYKGEKIGAYRDEAGILHGVRPLCPHMKCPLQFNREEHTWDCPCHGSRFDADGHVIDNPACRPLKRKGPD